MTTTDPLAPVVPLPRRRVRRPAACVGCGTPLPGAGQPHGRCTSCREGLPVRRARKARRPRAGTWADRALAEHLADAA